MVTEILEIIYLLFLSIPGTKSTKTHTQN